jgi:hypothetical protein
VKILFIIFIFTSTLLFSNNLIIQQQNTLYVQNLIEKEEQIAKAFEKYLLEEFAIPTIEDLQTNNYLGSNFSIKNKFGLDLSLDGANSKLNYAITKGQEYIKLLYERELYRDYTTVYKGTEKEDPSFYVEISLKSKEAQNIFKILTSGNNITILKECKDDLINTWCSLNDKIIKYYDSNKDWIEYSKKDYTNGDVNVSKIDILNNNTKMRDDLKIGIYIFVENRAKYIKYYNSIPRVK